MGTPLILTKEYSVENRRIELLETSGVWSVVYWQLYAKKTYKECMTFEEAYNFLRWGENRNLFTPQEIIAPDGSVFLSMGKLMDYVGLSAEEVFTLIKKGN